MLCTNFELIPIKIGFFINLKVTLKAMYNVLFSSACQLIKCAI